MYNSSYFIVSVRNSSGSYVPPFGDTHSIYFLLYVEQIYNLTKVTRFCFLKFSEQIMTDDSMSMSHVLFIHSL